MEKREHVSPSTWKCPTRSPQRRNLALSLLNQLSDSLASSGYKLPVCGISAFEFSNPEVFMTIVFVVVVVVEVYFNRFPF